MEELANAGSRTDLSRAWLAQARRSIPTRRKILSRCSASARLSRLPRPVPDRAASLLRAARTVPRRQRADGARSSSPRAARAVRAGTNGAALARRYEAYRKLVRRFYGQVFGRLRRQVVLVDLLTALQTVANPSPTWRSRPGA